MDQYGYCMFVCLFLISIPSFTFDSTAKVSSCLVSQSTVLIEKASKQQRKQQC